MQQHAGMSCKIICKVLWNSKETDKIIIEKATAFKSASETEKGREKLKYREVKEEKKMFPMEFLLLKL